MAMSFDELIRSIVGVPILLALFGCFARCYHKILKRGYYWYWGALVGWPVSLVAGFSIAFVAADSTVADDKFMLIGSVASCVIASFLPALFPVRTKRRAGQRRRLWKLAQNVAFGVAAICGTGCILRGALHPDDRKGTGLFAEGTLLALLFAWVIGTRAKWGRNLEDELDKDARPPVLYLREFGDEPRPFVIEGIRHPPHPALAAIPGMLTTSNLRFEDYLTEAIESSLGPLIALGNPDDYFAPRGAAREYVGDTDWRGRFQQLAARAQVILLSPGSSDPLRWELDQILRSGIVTKLFVVLGPFTFHCAPHDSPWTAAAGRWIERFTGISKAYKPLDWERFRNSMAEIGYQVLNEPPIPPTIITFDSHARSIVLNGTFRTPEEYVRAIQARRVL